MQSSDTCHVASLDADGEMLCSSVHDTSGASRMRISVIQTLADLLGVDPTETPLELNQHIDPALLDALPRAADDSGASLSFVYGRLTVRCFSGGEIRVYGQSGDVDQMRSELLDSMRSSTQAHQSGPGGGREPAE